MKIRNSILTPRWGDIQICKHKSFEYQFEGPSFGNIQPYECGINLTSQQDHAGISFTLGIRGLFWLNLNIHDRRHWDYENNTWKKY